MAVAAVVDHEAVVVGEVAVEEDGSEAVASLPLLHPMEAPIDPLDLHTLLHTDHPEEIGSIDTVEIRSSS